MTQWTKSNWILWTERNAVSYQWQKLFALYPSWNSRFRTRRSIRSPYDRARLFPLPSAISSFPLPRESRATARPVHHKHTSAEACLGNHRVRNPWVCLSLFDMLAFSMWGPRADRRHRRVPRISRQRPERRQHRGRRRRLPLSVAVQWCSLVMVRLRPRTAVLCHIHVNVTGRPFGRGRSASSPAGRPSELVGERSVTRIRNKIWVNVRMDGVLALKQTKICSASPMCTV